MPERSPFIRRIETLQLRLQAVQGTKQKNNLKIWKMRLKVTFQALLLLMFQSVKIFNDEADDNIVELV